MRLIIRHIGIISICFLIAALEYCGPSLKKIREMTPAEKFATGKKLFNDGDYSNAQLAFDMLTRLNIITNYSDSAQFLLAESYYNAESFILAQSEYQRLVQVMPGSPLVKDSYFKIGMCYYKLSPKATLDQEYTLKALRAFQQFLEEYPLDQDYTDEVNDNIQTLRGKLAEKDFLSGDLYRRMGEPESAIIYYDFVLREYYDTPIAAKTLYHKARAFEKLKKYEDMQETLQIFIENFPNHELYPKASNKMNEIKAIIAKTDTTKSKAVRAKPDSTEIKY